FVWMLGFEETARFGKAAAGVLPSVPFMRADRCEKMFHRGLITGEEFAIEMARIPLDQDTAEVEHDDIALRCRHRRLSPVFARKKITAAALPSQSRLPLG